MKNILLLLAVFVFCLPGVIAVADTGLPPVSAQVDYLPQDQHLGHVTVLGHGPKFRQVASWFDHGDLAALKGANHFQVIDTSSETFKAKYAADPNYAQHIRGNPTVWVQDASAKLLFSAAGNEIDGPDSLAVKVTTACWRRHRMCPQSHSQTPGPDVSFPDTEPQPLVPREEPTQLPPGLFILGLVACSLCGGGAGAAYYFKRLDK